MVRINLDFFRNDWMVGQSYSKSAAIPRLITDEEMSDMYEEELLEGTWIGMIGFTEETFQSDEFASGQLQPPTDSLEGKIKIPIAKDESPASPEIEAKGRGRGKVPAQKKKK